MARHGAHVIVVGNEKGGSGKSTTAFHLAVYLMYQGFRIATIDVDSRQQTFTHYMRNRRSWAKESGVAIPCPKHFHLPTAWGDSIKDNHKAEYDVFRRAVGEVQNNVDFLIIDTPGFDTNLTRISHSIADTLITPINDSLIDIDVLARIDAVTGELIETSHYSRLVQRARSERLSINGESIDWILVRNRISMLGSRNTHHINSTLNHISARLGCRIADGIAERVIFRSLFASGLTVFDPHDDELMGGAPTVSHASARQEYRNLVEALHLPVTGFAPAPEFDEMPRMALSA